MDILDNDYKYQIECSAYNTLLGVVGQVGFVLNFDPVKSREDLLAKIVGFAVLLEHISEDDSPNPRGELKLIVPMIAYLTGLLIIAQEDITEEG